PSRPVAIVVPSAPGGLADVTARPFAAAMAKVTGQSFVVDPRPGAGGAVGIAHVARQKADGYTLLWGLNSFLSIPEVEKITGRPATLQVSQFEPVGLALIDAQGLVGAA